MYDRSLGFLLAVIFGAAGIVLLVIPFVTDGVVDNPAITMVGGVVGIALSVIFMLSVVIRRRCRRNRAGRPDEECVPEGQPR